MANFLIMSSNIVKEVGTEVAQFMGYSNLKLNNNWDTFKARMM